MYNLILQTHTLLGRFHLLFVFTFIIFPNSHAFSRSINTNKAIISEIDWSQIAHMDNAQIIENSFAVGLLSLPGKINNHCTAFLISEDVIMTNWHCFVLAENVIGAKLYLDFYNGSENNSYRSTPSYNCGTFLYANRELDFTLLYCQGSPGKTHGYLKLKSKAPSSTLPLESNPIYMIHQNCDYWANPRCAPTKVYSPGLLLETDQDEKISYYSRFERVTQCSTFFHTADSLAGSSGAPIISAQSDEVVGLHHAGPALTPNSQGRGDKNEGIYMHLIVETIKKVLPDLELTK